MNIPCPNQNYKENVQNKYTSEKKKEEKTANPQISLNYSN